MSVRRFPRRMTSTSSLRRLRGSGPVLAGDDLDAAVTAADQLAAVVNRFFERGLVMHEDEQLKANRLRLLRDVRDTVGALGDLSQLPL